MIRVLDESGSAEAATSPSHGSDHSRQESAPNTASDTTRGPRGASRAVDYKAAYNSLGDMICTTRARIAVLCLIADGFMEGDVGVDHVRLPSGDVDCLLFMIEEARSVVSALDERYRSIEGAEMVAYVEEHARIQQANAMRLEDNEAVAELIVSHRKAERELGDALAQAERKGPDRGDIEGERIRVAMEAEKAARKRLLAWRPRTVGASADRLNYLLCDRDGPWCSTMPEGADLHEFARSMLGLGDLGALSDA